MRANWKMFGATGGLLVMAVGGSVLLANAASGEPQQAPPPSPPAAATPVLSGVDPALLYATNEVSLTLPTPAQLSATTVTQEQAVKIALAADPDYALRNARLVLLRAPVVGADGCICWAVSLMPPDGRLQDVPAPGIVFSPRADIYYITFVDARSGQLLFSAQGGRETTSPRPDPSFTVAPITATPAGTPGPGRDTPPSRTRP